MFSGIFQPMHLIVILVIVLIVWGPGKLPEIGEGLGKSIKAFKKAINNADTQTVTPIEEGPSQAPIEHQATQAAVAQEVEASPAKATLKEQE